MGVDERVGRARSSVYCQETVAALTRTLGAGCGAVFGFDGSSGLSRVAHAGLIWDGGPAEAPGFGLLEEVAERAYTECRAVAIEASTGGRVAIPLWVDGSVVGAVAVLNVEACSLRLEEWVARLDRVLVPLALAVDRIRMLAALEDRTAQIGDLRRQLDVYAADFRSTYVSELARSDELAAALAELEVTYRATVRGLAIAVEAKDEVTGGHLQRVTRYGMALTALVAPDHGDDPQFEYGFLLHDIGKLTVPDGVLTKGGPLTEEEWELIRLHPGSGRSILEGIPFLEGAREIVYSHHERWDGEGYPRGLAGWAIPLGARIFPLCDAFDAMTSDRPYRTALSVEEARAELRRGTGSQFWPEAVEAFLSLPVDELEALRGVAERQPE